MGTPKRNVEVQFAGQILEANDDQKEHMEISGGIRFWIYPAKSGLFSANKMQISKTNHGDLTNQTSDLAVEKMQGVLI